MRSSDRRVRGSGKTVHHESSQPSTDTTIRPILSNKQHAQPVILRSQSVGLDPARPAQRHSRRTRRDATSNSTLLIKAYLKNPVNPVPFRSPLKTSQIVTGESSQTRPSAERSSSSIKPSRVGTDRPDQRRSPPRLNGPFLRIRADDDYVSRRVDALFYGPVDPLLVDPSIDHPIYYTFPALEEALMTPIDCCECDLFDPVILHPSLPPLRHSNPSILSTPSSSSPFSSSSSSQSSLISPESLVHLTSELFPWDNKKGIGPFNIH
ncbi:hypothetical protein PGT21_013683 [Puccinia graminis f. sp. tritici]|uniref:Uncharacterized protein n=1 Tax=Puccinia graminis f. sp. tritici TaxID=56615 RepID=A0A5B0QSZ5_PUCGR|nr:hypothetical protein PGT21_013683 [Puccinia graminis f. sp. tritici]